jgi:hypothetical protein
MMQSPFIDPGQYRSSRDLLIFIIERNWLYIDEREYASLQINRHSSTEIVCLAEPEPFRAIGQWYADFSQVSDDEVRQILDKAWNEPAGERT